DPDGRIKITSITRKGIPPSYRGVFELVPAKSSPEKFSAVNVLPMQDYLKAVVPNELPIQYGYEAVKAQAVAARNYAIHPRGHPSLTCKAARIRETRKNWTARRQPVRFILPATPTAMTCNLPCTAGKSAGRGRRWKPSSTKTWRRHRKTAPPECLSSPLFIP